MTIEQALDRTIEWEKINISLIQEIKLQQTDRIHLSAALLHISIQHHRSFLLLVKVNYFCSALAIFRPQLEAFIRGTWISRCANGEQIKNIFDGNNPPKIEKLIEDIDKTLSATSNTLNEFKSRFWGEICDYTHGGSNQITNVLATPGVIQQTVDPVVVEGHLALSSAVALLTSLELAMLANNQDMVNLLLQKFNAIYDEILPINPREL
jgi:hypothetical protein